MKLIVHGYTGRMGQIVSDLAANGYNGAQLAARVGRSCPAPGQDGCYAALSQYDGPADCVVDFSSHLATGELLGYCLERRLPLVIAATGHTEAERALIEEAAGRIPIFFSANMSLGVNLLIDLVCRAAKILEDSFDIEIIEKHHNQKLDAPSGTALAIADAISDAVSYPTEYVYDRHSVRKKRDKHEIGLHAVRGGTIVGEHDVIFAGTDEVIEIKHSAASKEVFAVGAVRAAIYLQTQKPGLYTMKDLIVSQQN